MDPNFSFRASIAALIFSKTFKRYPPGPVGRPAAIGPVHDRPPRRHRTRVANLWSKEPSIETWSNAADRRLGCRRRGGGERAAAHGFAMQRIDAAADDQTGADHGPDIRYLAEHQIAADCRGQQIAVSKRYDHREVG